jgi:peptide/nickel transport system substrate-binding protein
LRWARKLVNISMQEVLSRKIGLLLMVTLIVLTLVLSGCSQSTSTEDEPKDKIVRIAQWNPPTGLFHPELLTSDYDSSVASLIYESLVEMSPSLEFIPALADEWIVSEDNLSVTFKINPDAKWHDGQPVTAEDVKFSLMFVGHKDYTGPRYSNVEPILGMPEYHAGTADDVAGIEIIDEKTVKITTAKPFGPFLLNIGGRYVMPKHIWGEVAVATADQERGLMENPVGSGPFVFKEFAKDQYVALEANKDYYRGAPKIDGIVIQAVSQDTAQAQLLKGEIDIMSVSDFNPDGLKALTDAGVQIKTAGLVAVQYMGVNHRNPDFQNKLVRQAMAHAINRQSIVDDLLYGKGNVADNPFPKTIWAYPGDDAIKHYEYNPERAIELFQEASYEYKDGTMTKDGKPVKWTLKYPVGNKVRERAAELIQQNMKDIGVEIELMLLEFQALSDAAAAGDFDLFLMGMGTSFDADQLYIWGPGATFNYCGFRSEEGDALLQQGASIVDIEERKPIYKEWALYMNDQIPNVWLYNWDGGLAVSPRLQGVEYFAGGSYHDIINWEIK